VAIEEARIRLRRKLEETFGVDEAGILMDRPPGGWGDLVTHDSLHRELAAMERRFDLKLAALESRLDARFIALEARIDGRFAELEARLDARFVETERGFDAVNHRLDRFEHQLLAQVDRRLRAQSWVTMSTVIAAMGIIVAAIRV
jgi:hypothetical protein